MSSAKKMLLSAAGNAGDSTDVADVFSTFLFDGTGSNQTITNGIDLDGEGGLVWIKTRSVGYNNVLTDTARGVTQQLSSNQTDGQQAYSTGLTAFNDNGFTIGSNGQYNNNNTEMTSWTFRKSPKFFDIVTYTGNGSNRTIAHSLDSTVGMIMIKNLGVDDPWAVYHRGANEANNAENYYFSLNTTAAKVASANWWNNTAPTSSVFTVSTDHSVNANGENYVAYLFAHNDGDGEFGSGGDSDIIKCGTFQGQGTFNIGFEPQWVMIKRDASATYGDWMISDKMRGWNVESAMKERFLAANVNTREAQNSGDGVYSNSDSWEPTATGFRAYGGPIQSAGNHYIYMAIRAPMITEPEAATEVFSIQAAGHSSRPTYTHTDVIDMAFMKRKESSEDWYLGSRIISERYLVTNKTNSIANSTSFAFDYNKGWYSGSTTNRQSWMWKRAKGFFDIVTYSGNGTAGRTVAHNLGVAPEMMWVKNREDGPAYSSSWGVYHGDNTNYLLLNDTQLSNDDVSFWNDTSPTSSVFTVGTQAITNKNNTKFIAYLFATLAGISKVGSYTGTGSHDTHVIDCGFSNGARFVLLKRTDDASDWFLWDSVRGITTSADSRLSMQSAAAEYNGLDDIRPHASGFIAANPNGSDVNADGSEWIFYAIA